MADGGESRFGTAVFAAGLALAGLAGPQAPGIAHADEPGPEPATTAASEKQEPVAQEVRAARGTRAAVAGSVAERTERTERVRSRTAKAALPPQQREAAASETGAPAGDPRVAGPIPLPAPSAEMNAPRPADVVVGDLSDLRPGNDPAAPAVAPLAWSALANARRELSARPKALAAPPGIAAAPVVPVLTDGIINGTVAAAGSAGFPLFYTILTTPDQGGKLTLNGDTGRFAYLPDYGLLTAGGTERFSVAVSEKTPIVAVLESLIDISEVRNAIRGIVASLQQIPIVNTLLAPIIGSSAIAPIAVDTGLLVPSPADTPVAYTVKVTSFDDIPISSNYYPATGLQAGQTAPTVYTTAGLSSPGQTDPYLEWDPSIVFVNLVPGVGPLREAGYNVVTWDSRGKAASGGVLEMGAPQFEGRDASVLIDYFTAQGWTSVDAAGDPMIGMVGGSYGGGMQLVDAAADARIKAIVPGIAWNSLKNSLYPQNTFNTLWGALLPILLASQGARVNPEIYLAALTGVLFGSISQTARDLLARTGPGERADDITAATLLIQGIPDTTFPLNEAVTNAELLAAAGTPVKMIWYCGGHGVCLNPQNPGQDDLILDSTLGWLDRYVRGEAPAQDIPTFRWVDQFGQFFGSDLMPFDPEFNGDPITAAGPGGLLPIVAALGGGGPSLAALPLSLLATGPALNAVRLSVKSTSASRQIQIVGSPDLSFTYAGVGLATHLYAQIIDDQTGLVLANAVTPIPVTLDGQTRTVDVRLASVAHTLQPGSSLTLQLTNAGLPFLAPLALGLVDVQSIRVSLPTVADGVAVAVSPTA